MELAGAGLLVLLVISADEPVGSLLGALGAALLATAALRDAALRPTLTADASGLGVRRGARLVRIDWADVGRLTAASSVRRLSATRSLEIDTDAELIVLAGRRLGADPTEVAEALSVLRAHDTRPPDSGPPDRGLG